jgi:putative DNA methylase
MILKACKRLAEVDFPIAVVSKHSAREKSIRHGHPSTLHLWWARRPLAACRAMFMALLLPDPCDPACPEEFRTAARSLLRKKHGRPRRWKSQLNTPEGLRKTLLEFGLWGGVGPRKVVECNEEGVLEGTIYALRMMFLATKMCS